MNQSGFRQISVAVAVAIMLLPALVWGEETPAKATSKPALRSGTTTTRVYKIGRRESEILRRQELGMHQFQRKDGTMVFTNRPEKYKGHQNYTEIHLDLKPISVPTKYREYKSITQYSTSNIRELVQQCCQQYQIAEDLVWAVIKMESNFNPNAVSSAGACGLMQLMPGTAAEMGVINIFDPAQNIAGGTQYLTKMLEIFDGNVSLAVAAYNAGPENVKKYGGIPPFPETQAYVRNVMTHTKFLKRGIPSDFGRLTTKPTALASKPPAPEGKRYIVHFHSGLTQPADRVVEKDPYYYIDYGKRTYPVRKDLVKEIEEPA